MFSAYNVARAATMELLDVDDFEFSQVYGFFYDKLEKFNVGLEYVIETAGLPLDSARSPTCSSTPWVTATTTPPR